MMYSRILAALLCLVLVPLAAGVAAADEQAAVQEPAAPAPAAPPSPVEAPALCPAPAASPVGPPELAFSATTAICSANCWCGADVECSGASCYAVDSSCPAQRGYCWGSTTGYRYCPQCCSASTPCFKYEGKGCAPNGSTIPCLEGCGCAQCICSGGTWHCP
jgi:hypothetical protein